MYAAAGVAPRQCQILRFGNGPLASDWVKDEVTKAYAEERSRKVWSSGRFITLLDTLVSVLDTEIIRPAEVRFDELIVRKAETMKGKHV